MTCHNTTSSDTHLCSSKDHTSQGDTHQDMCVCHSQTSVHIHEHRHAHHPIKHATLDAWRHRSVRGTKAISQYYNNIVLHTSTILKYCLFWSLQYHRGILWNHVGPVYFCNEDRKKLQNKGNLYAILIYSFLKHNILSLSTIFNNIMIL